MKRDRNKGGGSQKQENGNKQMWFAIFSPEFNLHFSIPHMGIF